MSAEDTEKITFNELARRVVEAERRPMTVDEIWQSAQRTGWVSLVKGTGKTPKATLGARLYRDAQKPSSLFVKLGSRPAKFLLKSLANSIPNLEEQVAAEPAVSTSDATYSERQLHPLLVWFAKEEFGASCVTILHEQCDKLGPKKKNRWIHPDIVGFALTTEDWEHSVVELAKNSKTMTARLYSFELKISIGFANLREYFFQAVSNSSWAHEGYLVAVEIDGEKEFQDELARLSESFGIGVIQLDIDNVDDCEVLLPAREKPDIDWPTVNRIAGVNPGFAKFVQAVENSVRINRETVDGFDEVLEDAELEAYLKKLRGG